MRTKKTKIMFCVLALAFALTIVSQGADEEQKDNPYLWKSKVTSVTVFKNGLGFFLREGQTSLRDGWCVSGAIPPASFGTLAIFPHEEGRSVDIVGSGPGDVVEFDGVDAPEDIDTKRTRLESCMYLKVEQKYRQASSFKSSPSYLPVRIRMALLDEKFIVQNYYLYYTQPQQQLFTNTIIFITY